MPAETRYRLNAGTAAAKAFDEEVIVINVVTGRYYSLEGTGAVAWMCLIGGAGVAEAGEAIAERYEVEPGRAAADVERLAAELVAEKLLLVGAGGPEEAEPLPPAVAGSRAPYAEPVIVTFTDMEDLLAFDPPLPPGDHQVWEASEPR